MSIFSDIGGAVLGAVESPFKTFSNVIGGISGQSASDANSANQASADHAFAESQGSADKQMDFQKEMSNTSYQRGMKDMEKAGLNPMLAYMNGGASVPSGSSAQGVASQNQDVGGAALNNIGRVAGATKDLSTIPSTLSQMAAQTKQANATAAATEAVTPAQVGNMHSQTALNNASAMVQSAQAQEIAARTPTYKINMEKAAKEVENLGKIGSGQDIHNAMSARENDWEKAHPHLYRMDRFMKSIKGGIDAGKTGAEIGTQILP